MLETIINALCDAEDSWLWGTLHASIGKINKRSDTRQIDQGSDCVLPPDDDLADVDSYSKGH